MNKVVGIGFVFFQVGLLSAVINKTTYRLGLKTVMASCSSKPLIGHLIKDFGEWQFSPSKLLSLPVETINENYVRRNIHNVLFSYVKPTPLTLPRLVAYSKDVLTNILDLDVSVTKEKEFVEFVSGNYILNSSKPVAHRYGGHQFGYWAMQLGDGRAILLGEYTNSAGEKWELQLKGSGKTPYSRDGDGRAVLRSSIREFLCSEAMHYLGIPTSRAGALIVSDDTTIRDPLYNGNPVLEKMAVVLRLAPTWFRFGSFELLTKMNEISLLKTLTDFVIKEHFPDIDPKDEDRVLSMLSKVARLTSDLVLAWQAVGFTHGVLNTDNMSILGITIDYGPFGFLEDYDPIYVPNASDSEARYCYSRQVEIIVYNLVQLSHALAPLLSDSQKKEAFNILQTETKYLEKKHAEIFSNKLGLAEPDADILTLLITMLEETSADFTMLFRDLGELPLDRLDKPCATTNWALAKLATHKEYPNFLEKYRSLLKKSKRSDEQRRKQMNAINPRYVLRNWMAQKAIQKAENDDFSEVDRLLRILTKPFERQEEAEKMGYASPPPTWSKNLILSCSS